jgi:hypothetical protein
VISASDLPTGSVSDGLLMILQGSSSFENFEPTGSAIRDNMLGVGDHSWPE